MKKPFMITLAIITTSTLIACSQPTNPLSNDETVADLKRFIAFYPHDQNFYIDCKNYLIGKEQPNKVLKARCDNTVNFIFNKFQGRDAFIKAKPSDRWDPKLWRRIFSAYDE